MMALINEPTDILFTDEVMTLLTQLLTYVVNERQRLTTTQVRRPRHSAVAAVYTNGVANVQYVDASWQVPCTPAQFDTIHAHASVVVDMIYRVGPPTLGLI